MKKTSKPQTGRAQVRPHGFWQSWRRPFVVALLLSPILIDAIYLATLWPDWRALASGQIPKSRFIREYEQRVQLDRKLPRLRWRPVALEQIPESVQKAALAGEDSLFYQHHGFDWQSVWDAVQINAARGRLAFGASTISQQTVKNMYLTRERSWLRKWHELVLTWAMERHLSKRRILSLYLNVAEFGAGIYGVEAAARAYFGKPASDLSVDQAAALAATLPRPSRDNPSTQTRTFVRYKQHLRGLLAARGFADAPEVNADGADAGRADIGNVKAPDAAATN
jgi:monofunctional glycosyltransferase